MHVQTPTMLRTDGRGRESESRLLTKGGGTRRQQSREGVRRAGATFVHISDRLSASAYDLSVMLRPTRSPCSAQLPPY